PLRSNSGMQILGSSTPLAVSMTCAPGIDVLIGRRTTAPRRPLFRPMESAHCGLHFSTASQGGTFRSVCSCSACAGIASPVRLASWPFFFAFGTGANGNSVFISPIAGVLGDYATTAPMETFMASGSDRHPTELAGLRGARLVTATETEEGRRWNETRIKT